MPAGKTRDSGNWIPFDAINAAALTQLPSLLRDWFPNGERAGHANVAIQDCAQHADMLTSALFTKMGGAGFGRLLISRTKVANVAHR